MPGAILFQALLLFLRIFSFLILARVLISWFRPGGGYYRGRGDLFSQIQEFLYRVTDPLLEPIRRVLPTGGMGIDFSPMVALLLIQFLSRLLVQMAR